MGRISGGKGVANGGVATDGVRSLSAERGPQMGQYRLKDLR